MDSTAINTVTAAVKALLEEALDPAHTGTQHVFVGPLDDAAGDKLNLHLFLYRVAVNADLRSSDHVVPSQLPNQPPTVYQGSLPLDLYYLLTASTKGAADELSDLTMLGQAMQALNDAPVLSGLSVKNETARITLDPIGSEEMSRIWALFPTANYRTSVVYLVSPVWIDPAIPQTAGAPVVEEPLGVGQLVA
ncbi:MAG TPA: DUF4255 domain-containing protein [Bryobacteraceae bacterium]|nr:DUF4255 domain-containing protein [Bryobacteraceae bacterium]